MTDNNFFETFMNGVNELVNVSKANTYAISTTNDTVTKLSSLVDGLSAAVRETDNKIETIVIRIDRLELEEEITSEQHMRLLSAARKRIYEILGDNPDDHSKYYKTFSARLYCDAKRESHMGPQISMTKKGDYNTVMNYIEAWKPRSGVENLKTYADGVAERRRKAREEGYLPPLKRQTA